MCTTCIPPRLSTYSLDRNQHVDDDPNRPQPSRAHLHHGQGKIIITPIITWEADIAQPDGVDRGLAGEILSRFEKRGFKLIASKLARPSRATLETRLFCLAVVVDRWYNPSAF